MKYFKQVFLQDEELLIKGILFWLIPHLVRLQVLTADVKMLGLHVVLAGWQPQV